MVRIVIYAADTFKETILALDETLPEIDGDAKVVLTLHDEIIVECDEADAGGVEAVVGKIMTDTFEQRFKPVPFVVNVKKQVSWGM
jgi:DNA polymerase I-like protein with 3'-5' exonuclease and polymerase domains